MNNENLKNWFADIIGAVLFFFIYFGISIPLYLCTSLEFIQSQPCQSFLLLLFFVAFAISVKVVWIVKNEVD